MPSASALKSRGFRIVFRAGYNKVVSDNKNARWPSYCKANNTIDYFRLGGTITDWRYDLRHGIVSFEDISLQDAAVRSGAVNSPVSKRRRPGAARFSSYLLGLTTSAILGTHTVASTITKAAYMDVLGGRTYIGDGSYLLNVCHMAGYYDKMRSAPPGPHRAVASDVTDDLHDYMLTEIVDSGRYDSIYLSVADQYDVVIDERRIAQLKGLDRDVQLRMVKACVKEMRDLLSAGTFQLVRHYGPTMGSRFVLKVKYLANGDFDKDKARCVTQGFVERLGRDFFSTFSPMASLTSVRMMFAVAVRKGLAVFHADIPNAFVRAETETELHMRPPHGVNIFDKADPSKSTDNGWVLRLLRSLYGLKDAGVLFNKELHGFFVDNGYTRSNAETSMYYRCDGPRWVVVLTEVDDLVVTGTDDAGIEALRKALVLKFAKKDDAGVPDARSIHWEHIKSFMGIDIKYDIAMGIMSMNVKAKIDGIFEEHKELAKIGMQNTPIRADFRADGVDDTHKWKDIDVYLRKHYANIVGSLIYISITCRPDITHAVGKLSKGMQGATHAQCIMLRNTLKYLNHTRGLPLVYRRAHSQASDHFRKCHDGNPTVVGVSSTADWHDGVDGDGEGDDLCVGFSDANFAESDVERRRSTSGWAFFVFGNLVSWKSKLQPITAGSTHEAELIALSLSSDEGIWLRKFMCEIDFALKGYNNTVAHIIYPDASRDLNVFLSGLPLAPTTIHCDNLGTVHTANNPVTKAKSSKHLALRYFRVRDFIESGDLLVHHCRTDDNLADFFTKALPAPAFTHLRNILMGRMRLDGVD